MTANDFRAAFRTRTAAFFLGAAIIAGTGLTLIKEKNEKEGRQC